MEHISVLGYVRFSFYGNGTGCCNLETISFVLLLQLDFLVPFSFSSEYLLKKVEVCAKYLHISRMVKEDTYHHHLTHSRSVESLEGTDRRSSKDH